MYTADTFKHEGMTIEIIHDEEPRDPLGEFGHAGTLILWSDYAIRAGCPHDETTRRRSRTRAPGRSDQYIAAASRADVIEQDHDVSVVVGVRFEDYGSNGARLYVDDGDDTHGAWIFDQKTIDTEWSGDAEKAREYAAGMIEEIDHVLQGDVWGIRITDPEGDEQDSCWGFIGDAHDGYIPDTAREMAAHAAETYRRELAERADAEARDIITGT